MADVSVVIPARNASATLPRVLAALARQDAPEMSEVCVVDDGSSDGTAEIAEAWEEVTVVRQPCTGPSAARNSGADATNGAILAFLDADCCPTRGWLAAGLAAMERGHADLVQGAVKADPNARIEPFDRTLWVLHETGLYESANLFVRRDLFDRIGGFRNLVALPAGQHFGEDILFGWRARRAGARVGFSPDAVVHHAVFPRGAAGYVRERFRLGLFTDAAASVPELREHFFFKRLFLLPKTAAFDAALMGTAVAGLTRRLWPLATAAPYAVMLARYARGWGSHARRVAIVEVVADTIGFAALLRGSIRRRTIVL